MDDLPVPDFDDTPFTSPPAMSEARVAIVSTAGLHHTDQQGWGKPAGPSPSHSPGDQFWRSDNSFRVLDGTRRDLHLDHWSQNFDRSGFSSDMNVVFPVNRLSEMAQSGVIGSISPIHLSFVGAQPATLSSIRLDSGPAAARLLLDEGVDVVLLAPVCPSCTRTIGALSHVLEGAGLATVGISLVRGQTERIRPPRALFCRFPFGRPFGRPNDPVMQRTVIDAAFDLLTATEPVIADFPIELADDAEPLACTLPPRHDPTLPPEVDEAMGLRPAYERQLARSTRTAVGRAVEASGIPAAVASFVRIDAGTSLKDSALPGHVTEVASDIRSYYEEAALALSDEVPEVGQTESWYYEQCATGQMMIRVRHALRDADTDRDVWAYLDD